MKRVVLVCVIAACGGKKDKAAPLDAAAVVVKKAPDAAPVAKPAPDAAPRAPDAAPAAKLPTVKVGEDTLPIVSAFAIPERNDLQLQLSTWPATCEDHSMIPEGGRHVDLTIRKKLRPDGSWSWAMFGTYFEGRSTEGGFGEPLANATIDATPGARSTMELHVAAEAFSDSPALAIDGALEVVTCPPVVYQYDTPPPDAQPPQPEAFLTVAGQQLPIVGAGYLPSKKHGYHLMVSSHAVKCTEGSSGMADTDTFLTSSWPDVSLKLEYAKAYDRADGQPWSAALDGEWIDQWHSGDGSGLTASPKAPKGKREVELTLGGSATIGGYPVAWSGKVEAIVCP